MYNYYTSIVVSTLLGDPPKSGIRTIQQLADSKLEVSVEPTPYTKVYVEVSLTHISNFFGLFIAELFSDLELHRCTQFVSQENP